MAFINHGSREICCKIVYGGPGLGGKTTNVRFVHQSARPSARGRLLSLESESERTLFFDFLPLDLGTVRGYRVRLQLYTVPGQIFYRATRKLILTGLDGLVLVADSQPARMDANEEALADLEGILGEQRRRLADVPFVVQYNKRDLPGVLPVSELQQALNPRGVPAFEACAATGAGVMDTLRSVGSLVLRELRLTPTG